MRDTLLALLFGVGIVATVLLALALDPPPGPDGPRVIYEQSAVRWLLVVEE